MLKMALFDCVINEKCCSVDGGRGICPLFSSPPRGFDSSRVPTPGNLLSKAKKMLMFFFLASLASWKSKYPGI